MEKYSDSKFWNEYWKQEKRESEDFIFENLLNKIIQWKKVHSYMEIGGAPGSIMSFMAKVHNMDVSTVDFCDWKILNGFLKKQGLKNYKIYNEDFSNFNVEKHNKQYDMVASWGFVEHFDLETSGLFIQKQKALVADDGYLIVELPNIRGLNWLIYRVFNNALLKIHNTKTMDLKFINSEILKGNEFKILYSNYYLTSFFEFSESNEFFLRHKFIRGIFKGIKNISKKLSINNIPNAFMSPYMIVIAQKDVSYYE